MALTLRNVKGSALTHTEMDDNLTYLETEAQNVAEHDNAEHSTNYEPEFDKNTAFNKDFGTSADTVCEGNDDRLSDAREPTTHDSSKHSDMNVGTWAAGQLLIYDATNSELVNAALTAGTGLSVTEEDGSITVDNTDTGSSAVSSHESTYNHDDFVSDLTSVTEVSFASEYDIGTVSDDTDIDWADGNNQVITLSADITLTFSNMGVGHKQLRVIQDSTGSRTPTLPSGKWPGGNAGSFSASADAEDILSIFYNGTDYYYQLSKGWA